MFDWAYGNIKKINLQALWLLKIIKKVTGVGFGKLFYEVGV